MPLATEKEIHIRQGVMEIDTNDIAELVGTGHSIQEKFPDSAIGMYRQALAWSHQIRSDQSIAIVLLNISRLLFYIKEDYGNADSFIRLALPYCELAKESDKRLLPLAYNILAGCSFKKGEYDSAFQRYHQALSLIEHQEPFDTGTLITIYTNIGATIGNMNQLEQALSYFRKAAYWASFQDHKERLVNIYTSMGTYYSKRVGMEDSALTYYQQAIHLAQSREDIAAKTNIQNIYVYIATIWSKRHEIKTTLRYLDSAKNAYPDGVKDNWQLLLSLGYVYYVNGDIRKALLYYEKALKVSQEKGIMSGMLNNYHDLAAIYDSLGQGRLAYEYQKKYSELKDSLVNSERLKTINQLEIKYRTAEKDRQLAKKDLVILEAKTKSQRTAMILWLSSLCILSLIGFVVFLRYRQTNKVRQLHQQKELDILKASMEGEHAERLRVGRELHDGISGLLSAIKMNLATLRLNRSDIAEERNFITTMKLADEAADELRKTAHNLVSSNLRSEGLFKALRGFCERVTSAELDVQVAQTGNPVRLDSAKERIIYRNIQELIHNMIRHSNATVGHVSISWQDGVLLITVEDNGKGMASGQRNRGIGFKNIRNSIKKLQGTLEIDSRPAEGTSIYLEYPI